MLISASWGTASGTITIHYTDGTTTSTSLSVADWFDGPAGAMNMAYRYTPNGIDRHAIHIYVIQVAIDSTRTADSLILPTTAVPKTKQVSMHIFALTLLP